MLSLPLSSRLKGAPPPTRAPTWERRNTEGNVERIENLLERTDVVHAHFLELFRGPLQRETLGWRWQRWLLAVLLSLSRINCQRVRETAFAFRQRTSCADDHSVIEMLWELDEENVVQL